MKKKNLIIVLIILIIVVILGFLAKYVDQGRVATNNEPKYCIKIVSNDGGKITYWGLGYKVIRYVGVSPNEPYKNNIGVKMGSWFMDYTLPEEKVIKVELLFDGKIIEIKDRKDVEAIESLLTDSKYINELCDGINTHKITIDNEVYYIKESCKEIQKGNKQAEITDEDLKVILDIIDKVI